MATFTGKECEVCNEEFDERDRCPRSLPCSHCLCSDCIEKLIATKAKICPFCRQDFQASSAKDIGINTYLLEVLKLLKKTETIYVSHPSPTVTFHSKLVTEMKEETAKATTQIISSFREVKEQTNTVHDIINKLRNDLLKSNETLQNKILVKMKEIVTKNNRTVKYLDDLVRYLETQMEKMKAKESHMEAGIIKLAGTETLAQTATVVEEVDGMSLDSRKWLEKHKELICGYEEKRQTFAEVSSKTRDGLRILETGLEPLDWEEDFLPDLQSLSAKEDVPQEITIETLRERTSAVLDKLRSGKVFVFQDLGGRRRYAQLSLTEDDRICLHCFQEQQLPSDVHLLKHLDVMNLIDASSRSSFLNFGTDEKSLGRIYVSLTPNMKRSQNFSALCTGEMGPSYLNSQIIEVRRMGDDLEHIVCGDYDGIGGRTLISGAGRENGGIGLLKKPWLAGSVFGCCGDDNQAAQFQIIMRDYPSCIFNTIFGKVESNLHILSEAISLYSNISDIKITDCGIVIPI